MSGRWPREELSLLVFDRRNDQGAVEEVVVMLTGGFCNEETSVTSRSMQKAVFMFVLRIVLRTNRIVRAQLTHFKCRPNMLLNPPTYLNQSTQSPFGIGRSGIQKNTVPNLWQCIYPLANGARGVSAFQRDSGNQ